MTSTGSRKPLPSEVARATKSMKSLDLPTIRISRLGPSGTASRWEYTVHKAESLERIVRSFDELEGKLTKKPAA